MMEESGKKIEDKLRLGIRRLRALMNLRADTDQQGTIENIRSNVDFRSSNAWTLVFAILIASIGLNTNSAAVVIGAMLISPLMGPIIGAGLGLGVNDLPLVRRSLSNLFYAVAISLAASFLYFTLSPLSEAQSELVARTYPTFFDAMIAIFGGAAGIVAVSRKEKGNAIPGVAIATALMPPLCTAGYGLSQGNFAYFFGAMYLFVINSVYICLTTLFFIRYLGFPKVALVEVSERRRLRRWVVATGFLVLLPSIVSGWLLLKESSFRSRADNFIKREMKIDGAFVVGSEIIFNWRHPKLIVRVVGEPLSPERVEDLKSKMEKHLLPQEALEIHQSSFAERIEQKILSGLKSKNQEAKDSDLRLASLELAIKNYKELSTLSDDISKELVILFPKLNQITIVDKAVETPGNSLSGIRTVLVQWTKKPTRTELFKVDSFLQNRTKFPGISVSHFSSISR